MRAPVLAGFLLVLPSRRHCLAYTGVSGMTGIADTGR